MDRRLVTALRVVIALGLAGCVFVQGVMVPLLAIDLRGVALPVRAPVLAIAVLGVGTIEVVQVCVWRLLTLVRRGTVFSAAAFRYVDVVAAAVGVAALLAFTLGATLAPGEDVAPGMVLLIGGTGLLIAGVALLVLVLRALLAQAVARDAEAAGLQAELDAVI